MLGQLIKWEITASGSFGESVGKLHVFIIKKSQPYSKKEKRRTTTVNCGWNMNDLEKKWQQRLRTEKDYLWLNQTIAITVFNGVKPCSVEN